MISATIEDAMRDLRGKPSLTLPSPQAADYLLD